MTGKVAIITGGSQGIGAGLVAGYRARGWAVVASARTIAPSDDPQVLAVAGDITEAATAERIIDAALGRFGRIDTLVNNAGVYLSKPFTDYTADDYALVVGVNLTGFFWLTQRAIAEMATRYGGHVVNVSATLAEVANSAAPEVLAALTKGGLAAATRSLAIEYASRGIRVNAVSPGIIQTPEHPADSYEHLGPRRPPLGRAGQVSDVVDGILFLESSPYITGEILHIDGGQIAGHLVSTRSIKPGWRPCTSWAARAPREILIRPVNPAGTRPRSSIPPSGNYRGGSGFHGNFGQPQLPGSTT